MPTTFPSSAPRGHPLSPARPPAGVETRCRRVGPTEAFVPTVPREERRHPGDQDAFHRCDHGSPERIAPPASPCRPPRSRRPHVLPRLGGSALVGHCKRPCAANRAGHREGMRLLDSLEPRLGLTTQARHRARPELVVCAADCPARTTRVAAPRRLLRPRARGPMCRELHDPLMPDRLRTRKNKNRSSITFLSTRLSTARRPPAPGDTHDVAGFQGSIASCSRGFVPACGKLC